MRIRTIKPEFWLHEGLCGCSDFTRLLAIALLNWADDHGYFMANPALVRGNLFPFLDSSKMIPGSLLELSRVGWIECGKDNQGRDVGRIINFSKHQRVDKPKPSEIKGLWAIQDESKTNPGRVQDASQEERKGKEGEMEMEMERKGSTPAVLSPVGLSPVLLDVPESQEPGKDRRHHTITTNIGEAYREIIGEPLPFAKQFLPALSKFLNGWSGTADDFLNRFQDVLRFSSVPFASECKRAADPSYLCRNWTAVTAELTQLQAAETRARTLKKPVFEKSI